MIFVLPDDPLGLKSLFGAHAPGLSIFPKVDRAGNLDWLYSALGKYLTWSTCLSQAGADLVPV